MSQIQPDTKGDRRRSARLTPYSSHRSKKTASRSETHDHKPSPRQTEVITKFLSKTCHIFCVSPLWKFETSKRSVERYSKHLTGLLATPSKKRDISYTGRVGVVSHFGLDGSHAIEIIVKRINSGPRVAPVCYAMLCRMSSPPTTREGFSYLPLLCIHGLPDVAEVVMDWLSNTFDCHISAKKMEGPSLYMLVSKYATILTSGVGSKSKLELVYSTPMPVKKAGLATISLQLPYDSIVTLTTSDIPTSLQKILEELIHTHFRLKLGSLTLVRVSMPVLDVQYDATIKFSSMHHVMPILSALQQVMTD